MDSLYKKSTELLELPLVLEILASETVSAAARKKALELSPSDDADEINRRLDEVEGAVTLSGLLGSPSLYGLKDISGALERANHGGVLSPGELLDVAGLLSAARSAKQYAASERRPDTAIDPLFRELSGNKYLEDKITGAIISEEEISDLASSELASIRRKIRLAGGKVRETLTRIISSPHYQKSLQDPIITMRGNRYVVPVKSECRGDMPGLVHDTSSSGATLFIEPMQVVELNNEIRVLTSKEEQEIERILAELSAATASFASNIEDDMHILEHIDFVFAKARLAYKLDAVRPIIGDGGELLLRRARHPLIDKKKIVPIDISIGGECDTLVITGPNTGGKTVSLKTLGLLSLMAMCGLYIPAADRSRVPVLSAVLADIGDEQSIEQSLSTFSAHMKNIVAITERADKGCLALFDELGAGTDPVEGAALAMAIIEDVRSKGALVAATTHYAELKIFALSTPGVENASCEFDVETLTPTYRLITGVPGKSNAFAISERLGLSRSIIEYAGERVSTEDKRFEDVISKLEEQRIQAERRREEAEAAKAEASVAKAKAELELKALESERAKQLESARREARSIIENARTAADAALNELAGIKKKMEAGSRDENIGAARAMLHGALNDAERKAVEKLKVKSRKDTRPIKQGDVVLLPGTNLRAVVLAEPEKDGTVRLKAGIMQVTAKASELAHAPEAAQPEKMPVQRRDESVRPSVTRAASAEIDLRGKMSDEAILELDAFIDAAIMGKLTAITIIHGKGTGALRQAVHTRLRQIKGVKSFRLGRYGEGEMGVTIAELE